MTALPKLVITSCHACPIGAASEIGLGGRCPFTVDRAVAAGNYLYVEEEPVVHVWFVKRGQVILTRAEAMRGVRGAGEFLGLEALVQPAYLDSARVSQDARVCGAPLSHVDAWLGKPGTPARVALEQVVLSACREVPRGAARDGNAAQRVAQWLLGDADAGGEVGSPMPRRDLANLLGMTPETLSRILANLAAAGAIALSRREVRVIDRSVLATRAQR